MNSMMIDTKFAELNEWRKPVDLYAYGSEKEFCLRIATDNDTTVNLYFKTEQEARGFGLAISQLIAREQ